MSKWVVASQFVIMSLIANSASAETNEEPMKIREIMQGMQVNMQQIEQGIVQKDWELISQNALAIADHPAPPIFEKLRIIAYMNTDMGVFKKLDKTTHQTAKELAELVLQKDKGDAGLKFTQLKESCQQCHQVFRAEFQGYFYK